MADADTGGTAAEALCFADLSVPGIRRCRAGRGWRFVGPDGRTVSDPAERARLLAVGLPPAYRDAWYNPDPSGHIQATGVDDRGRLQYRYHPAFRSQQEELKFVALPEFGRALPAIRARVEADLARRDASRERVVAAVVRLLDIGHIRVGNQRYAQENRSFGATTLMPRHVEVAGARVRLQFRGKGGKLQRLSLSDRALARAVKACQDLPGQHLFTFQSADGSWRAVTSQDVNLWLQEAGAPGLTAKQFRTWWASVIGLEHEGEGLKPMLEAVSGALGNTPAIARKSYVHPAVIARARATAPGPVRPMGPRALSPRERRLMGLLASWEATERPAPCKG